MIYVHIPFCHSRCAYCAFYSTASQRHRDDYIEALGREADVRMSQTKQSPTTVYFGGGTPSILRVEELERIIRKLETHCDWMNLEESTLECNPEDLTPEYLSGLRDLGFFNRLSIGVQSFDDGELRAVGRRHSANQAVSAIEAAVGLGFDNISIDLIYGLPGQSEASWRRTLDAAFGLPIKHLSAYSLTVEPRTLLTRRAEEGRVALPNEDETMKCYAVLCEKVQAEGWEQYEISNFCMPGWYSRHNSRYWNHRTGYIGLGAAAHSYDPHGINGPERRWNVANMEQYIKGQSYETEILTLTDCYNEWLMLGLRTTKGLDITEIPHESFREGFENGIRQMIDRGWVAQMDGRYRPTPEGLLHADGMAAELFVA